MQGNVNVQNTEARNVFTERSEHGPLRPVRSRGGRWEAPLRVPAGFEILSCAPSTEQLDSSKAESDALLGKVLMVRFEHYGWCKGTITGKVVDRRRTINKEAINFIAEFDIDDGASTDLSLDVSEYDPSPSADYQSWLLLQEAAG